MANIYPGYMGLATIGPVGNVRFSDASITAKQTVDAPDLVMGDWDHDAYNYGKIEVSGSISGPVTDTFVSGSGGTGLWNWAVKRSGTCGTLSTDDIDLYYYCGAGNNHRKFSGMLVNSIGFSCAAGEVAQFTMDLMGKGAEDWTNEDGSTWITETPEKLITWDKVTVNIIDGGGNDAPVDTTGGGLQFSNIDFNISNNLQPVYSLAQDDLFPYEIVPGLRTVSGTISVYNIPTADGYDRFSDYQANQIGNITFTLTNSAGTTLTITLKVRFHRIEPALGVGPIISSLGFTGVGHQTQLDA